MTAAHVPAQKRVSQLIRRVRWAVFLRACARALVAVALVGAAALLALRLFDLWPAPSGWWALALVVPLAWGVQRVWAAGFGPGRATVHLDRRLGLGGLLLTGLERDTEAWRRDLDRRLAAAATWQPRIERRPWAHAALAVAGLAAMVLFLPPPAPQRPAPSLPIRVALDDLEEKVEQRRAEEILSDTEADELITRIAELRAQQNDGEPVAWADLDSLDAQLERLEKQRASDLTEARSALAALAGAGAPEAGANATEMAEAMAAAIEQAQAAGLLDGLDPALLAQLGMESGQAVDLAALPSDPAVLAELAAALGAALDGQAGDFAAAGLLDPSELEDLAAAVAAARAAQQPLEPAHQHGPG